MSRDLILVTALESLVFFSLGFCSAGLLAGFDKKCSLLALDLIIDLTASPVILDLGILGVEADDGDDRAQKCLIATCLPIT
jgi:hypothetical protein